MQTREKARARVKVFVLASLIAVSVLLLLDSLAGGSSTSALLILFLPIYGLVLGVFIFGLAMLVRGIREWRRGKEK